MIDWDVAVGFSRPVKPAEPRARQSTDSGEMASRNFFAMGKFGETGHDLVAFGEDHGVGLFSARIFGEQPRLQTRCPAQICDRPGLGVIILRRCLLGLGRGETGRREIATGE